MGAVNLRGKSGWCFEGFVCFFLAWCMFLLCLVEFLALILGRKPSSWRLGELAMRRACCPAVSFSQAQPDGFHMKRPKRGRPFPHHHNHLRNTQRNQVA